MIVDLVLNAEPPSHQSGRVDTEAYVHRSGRTGRAGRKGVCITLYTPRQRGSLGEIGKGIQWLHGCSCRAWLLRACVSLRSCPGDVKAGPDPAATPIRSNRINNAEVRRRMLEG